MDNAGARRQVLVASWHRSRHSICAEMVCRDQQDPQESREPQGPSKFRLACAKKKALVTPPFQLLIDFVPPPRKSEPGHGRFFGFFSTLMNDRLRCNPPLLHITMASALRSSSIAARRAGFCRAAGPRALSTASTASASTSQASTSAPTSRPRVIFSGIQPTGIPHLGNYLGAIQRWARIQQEAPSSAKLLFSIVDLHAITSTQKHLQLRRWKRETLAALLAAGLNPERCIIFNQSEVRTHDSSRHV